MKAAVKETNPHTPTPSSPGMVLQLLQKQPFIVWGASLVLVLLTGSIALRGLMSPGPSEPDSPPTAIASSQGSSDTKQPDQAASAEVEQSSNLWLFGAIGIGCTVGSFLLAKRLEQTDTQRTTQEDPETSGDQLPSPLTRRAKPAPAAKRSVRRQKAAKRPTPTRRVPVAAATVAANPMSMPVTSYPISPNHPTTEPVVTVVPDHETHPLDWGDASLADMMDLRKQRPLSHWL